ARGGGERLQVSGSQQDCVLHNGGRGRRKAADRPDRGPKAHLRHSGGLHHHPPAAGRQGEAVHGELRHAQSRGQGSGIGARGGGERPQVSGSQQHCVLHNEGRGRRKAADRQGRSLKAQLRLSGGLHHHSPAAGRQGEAVHGELRHAQSRGKGAGKDVLLFPPPPSYEECRKGYPPYQANDPGPSVDPGIQLTAPQCQTCGQSIGYAAQPGFQAGFQPPPGCQQGAPPFFYQGQPCYPTPHPYTDRPYPKGSHSGQQPFGQHIPGQKYTTTEVLFQVVSQPVQQPGNEVTINPPPDYMALAILATLCFFPMGFPAIFHASTANECAKKGDMRTAETFAESAQGLIIASFVVGGIAIILVIVKFGFLSN
ncbi:hypothetical protein DPMN_108216, partial [Dreissena polymorpha]